MSIQDVEMIFKFIGGLGMFLYGCLLYTSTARCDVGAMEEMVRQWLKID